MIWMNDIKPYLDDSVSFQIKKKKTWWNFDLNTNDIIAEMRISVYCAYTLIVETSRDNLNNVPILTDHVIT